jgi:hypothetical protein
MKKRALRNHFFFVVIFSAIMGHTFVFPWPVSPADPIIVDHTCTDLNQVPAFWINQAKASFRISYGHTSHGSQIVTGMGLLKGTPGSLYWFDHEGSHGGLSLNDCEPSGDLGNPDRTTWATRTRALLDRTGNDRNMIMWSWCGQVSWASEEDINTYLSLMNELEADYPDVTFIYMTGHLDGSGETGNLHIRNNQIRNFCEANNKILFDFADIESYDPDGNYFLDQWADDECYYYGGNWAEEWCAGNPGECASCSCAHSHCLNCQLKGRAFWWMMARLAGWGGSSPCLGDFDCDGLSDEDEVIIYGTDPLQADTDGDLLDDKYECDDSPCTDPLISLADMNLDTNFNAQDINDFRNCFMAREACADVNCDEAINARDINDFRNAYMNAQK